MWPEGGTQNMEQNKGMNGWREGNLRRGDVEGFEPGRVGPCDGQSAPNTHGRFVHF